MKPFILKSLKVIIYAVLFAALIYGYCALEDFLLTNLDVDTEIINPFQAV